MTSSRARGGGRPLPPRDPTSRRAANGGGVRGREAAARSQGRSMGSAAARGRGASVQGQGGLANGQVRGEDAEWWIASWNCSGLSDVKVERIVGLEGKLWVLQETHLAEMQVEQRKRDAARLQWRLVHGKAVPLAPSMRSGSGEGCGSVGGTWGGCA